MPRVKMTRMVRISLFFLQVYLALLLALLIVRFLKTF